MLLLSTYVKVDQNRPKDDFSRNLIGSLLIGYQMIYHSLTIFGILVVNTENKLCLQRTQLILGL